MNSRHSHDPKCHNTSYYCNLFVHPRSFTDSDASAARVPMLYVFVSLERPLLEDRGL